MNATAAIDACWTAYRQSFPMGQSVPAQYVSASAFGAAGEDALADDLAELVLQGIKTATSTMLQYYLVSGESREQAGDHCVVLRSSGQPCGVIAMTEVRTIPFGAVDGVFAAEYGEGQRTLAWWREHLGGYYARQCAANGWRFDDEAPLVCKRFRVVFRCPQSSPLAPIR